MKNKKYEDFLDYSVTSEENSVEKYFCKPLDKDGKRRNMDDEESKIMMMLLLYKDPEINMMYDDILKASHIAKILVSRAEYAGLKMDKKSFIMISMMCETPGAAVMYVYYLLYKSKELGEKIISFETLCSSIFPWGFFTEETLHFYWDEQKVKKSNTQAGTDNLLDYHEASSSLRIWAS
jgi:hypothetical protein